MRFQGLLLLALAPSWGCGSQVSSTTDTALQRRVETFEDCFPGLFARAEALLDLADTWRLNSSAAIPDPVGLTATVGSEAGGTIVDVTYTEGGTTIAMTIRFYSPTGVQQTLTTLPGAGSLNSLIDAAATELRNTFAGQEPFVVGDYGISGGGISATGEALTGILGGSGSGNELAELRTTATSSTVSGGPPAAASSTITDAGPPACSLTFEIPGLQTDASPTQDYPIGTLTLSIAGPQDTVTATLTFDGTATVAITVDQVPGSFTFQVETRTLSYVP